MGIVQIWLHKNFANSKGKSAGCRCRLNAIWLDLEKKTCNGEESQERWEQAWRRYIGHSGLRRQKTWSLGTMLGCVMSKPPLIHWQRSKGSLTQVHRRVLIFKGTPAQKNLWAVITAERWSPLVTTIHGTESSQTGEAVSAGRHTGMVALSCSPRREHPSILLPNRVENADFFAPIYAGMAKDNCQVLSAGRNGQGQGVLLLH